MALELKEWLPVVLDKIAPFPPSINGNVDDDALTHAANSYRLSDSQSVRSVENLRRPGGI